MTAEPTRNSVYPKTHISLHVRDVEHSVAFYEAFFGVSAHKRRPGYANFDLAEPPLKLALQQADHDTPRLGSLSHLGIELETAEEVQRFRERLTASGMVAFDEGDTVCCYARQDKVWVTDPDGNSWEVYVLLDEMNDMGDDDFAAGGFSQGTPARCGTGLPLAAQPAGSRCCG
ncbi:MAG: ArsI/CadI family heavy metal resistance metalloenzyme [Armatimonadaceae bacterium]